MNPKNASRRREQSSQSQLRLARSVGVVAVLCVSFAAGAVLPNHQHHSPRGNLEFSASITNKYVTLSSIPVEVHLLQGSPSSMAVVVDSTSFAAAAWMPYVPDATLTVNLGSKEGWHELWVGLRAQNEHSREERWKATKVKLDFTPPRLVITDPRGQTVTQQMIQVRGYCPEPLFRISYDLTNAAGVVSNQQVLVLDQQLDSRTLEFTVNTFQAFDVELATGPNTFTFHATDLAGNTTTTNLTVILDYSGKTNAPVIRLYWPQDGTQISGSDSYTWRGWMNDFTASVTAVLVDANGNTNAYQALVERDGKFWVENLPAPVGTNWLQLTVTDAVGNVNLTNITVVSSPVLLTLNPPEVTADQVFAIVTGTINSRDYTVWVNGVKAWLNGDGSWIASNTPVTPGGTAVFQARAIPNWDNGGNGSGGGGGGNPYRRPRNPANPDSVRALNWEIQSSK